jgi:diguanylate cyclase (GGDEF)-like protein
MHPEGSDSQNAPVASAPTIEQRSNPSRERELSDCYLGSLLMLGRCAAEVYPPIGQGVHETLLRLRRRLAFDPQYRGLTETHQVAEGMMRDFGRRAKEMLDRRTAESDHILQVTSLTANLLAARDRSYLEQFREVLRRLQNASRNEDEQELRDQIETITASVARTVETFQDDSKLSLAQLAQEIEEFERRRVSAQTMTILDVTTGLYNHDELQRRIRISMRVKQQFSVLKLSVHDFSALNDQLGAAGEEQLMKLVSERLTEQVRPRDIVGRWSPRVFLMIFNDCPLSNAESRAAQISRWLSDTYLVATKEATLAAEVHVTATATEPQPSETMDEFVARAEALSPVPA